MKTNMNISNLSPEEKRIAIAKKVDSPQDWSEDFGHENGRYLNTCHQCGRSFMGYKRRVTCKLCAAATPFSL